VLRKADFRVPAEGLTALVGLSGSGKTTALELIQRFVEADAGRVSVFGTDVARWDLTRLRARMAYLDQSSTLVQDSVRANLTLGRNADDVTDEELMRALDKVGLADVVRDTPDGLDTVLAGDTDLSGGQRQRLGIARAMLTEAPLILLDEPSSQLDSLNEQKLRDLVDDLARDRAVLVVAHRISTIQHADHVIVFEGGEVVGQGTHKALLRECPQYAQLVRGQALIGEAVPA
jgi:ABC-type multidrug transport system fused ATPase/permease subunit